MNRTMVGLLASGFLAVGAGAGAGELGGVTMHGFLSTGYVRTTENELFFARTTEGTFEFTDAAISFSTEPVPRLRIGAQLFAQDLGSGGNHRVLVDWAVGDYRVRDWFGARGGKLKFPLGLYGTLRDADIGRPEIFQPEAVYSDLLKDLVRSFDGAAVYGSVQAGGAGYVDYEVFGGAVDADESVAGERLAEVGLPSLTAALAAAGLQQPRASAEPLDATMEHMWGGALEYRPPVQGLRLRFSGWTHDSNLASRASVTGYLGPLPATFLIDTSTDIKHHYWVFASAEYQRGGLRVSAEQAWQKLTQTTTISGLPSGPVASAPQVTRPVGWYVQVAQRLDDKLQLSAYYSRYYSDGDDKDGSDLVATGSEAFRRWDKDLGLTARLDLAGHFLLKAEFHTVDGAARLGFPENAEGLAQNWKLFAVKGTFHF
ncbi:MAG TPA: hypothetical protein VFQ51_01395 [Vicinamibacteria bacterium]|nr:hypothetical protein [Vicinamibacteria bacterium]